MNRMSLLQPDTSNQKARDLLERTNAQLGRTPNLYRAMANAPAALDGYLAFRGALVAGILDAKMRERIALLVAEENACEYCVSAHAFRGAKIGIEDAELRKTRRGESFDPRVQTALDFVRRIVRSHGVVEDDDLERMRAAQWSDEAIGEMVAHVALNVFSNYFNHVAQPELDFPLTPLGTGKE